MPKWAVDDDVMWTALRRVALDGRVELLPKKLHSPVIPADLTMEERQLLCLARAVLRGCPVVVLDELERGVGGSVGTSAFIVVAWLDRRRHSRK